ncbi:MAG: hypothetical protein E6K56_03570 [Ignavibacteria bacterium]|nr:MAG: hypothetical protein E6K56_03570 [Ignavibacteria bacterium]
MGLLKRSIGILLLICLHWGCSYLRLQQVPAPAGGDWRMYGGGIGRTNVSHSSVEPPLAMLWEYDASAGFSPFSGAIAGNYLFVGNLSGEVHVIDIPTGKGMGKYDFGAAIVGTPVVDRDLVYLALSRTEESLLAYNLVTAKIEWHAKLGDIETSPLLMRGRLYVTSLEGSLICADARTGEIIWRFMLPANLRTRTVRSSPASDGAVVVFGCDNGDVYAVGVDDGKLRWTSKTGGSVLASPSVTLGKVFVGSLDNTFYAFDAGSGNLVWKQTLDARIYASQAVNDHAVYVGTSGRTVFSLDAQTGRVLWRTTTNSVINAPPLVSGSAVYVGSLDKTLYAFDSASGEFLWQYKSEGRIKTMPVAAGQYLFLFAEDRSVMAFKHSGPP